MLLIIVATMNGIPPPEYIESARKVMGSIDIDPASSDIANLVVKASTYYTADTNGLDKPWCGNMWMNPPYSSKLIKQFMNKVVLHEYDQAVILVNNSTETQWFSQVVQIASAVCFPRGRVKFYGPNGEIACPLQGQAILYVGDNVRDFIKEFSQYGWTCVVDHNFSNF